MIIPRGDAVALATALIRIDSRNPSLVPGAPGEGDAARFLAQVLAEWGLDVRLVDQDGGRPSVTAWRRGSGSGRSLLLNGHLDVVGTDGMTHEPFAATLQNGRLYGRGASDMKGGVAAMCAAAVRAPETAGDVIVTAVSDEEWQSAGTAAVLADGVRADAAIVTEPTGLRIMPAHKGFVWAEFTLHGRAAHGSRWDLGVDAIRHAGALLAELDQLEAGPLAARQHPLLGRPSLHASIIEGGSGMSTYPERCTLRVERRTIPGETLDAVEQELRQAVARAGASRPHYRADLEILFAQPPSDVPGDAPIVLAVADELSRRGLPVACLGMSAWTDAALLNAARIPAICFGPGDMGLAHAAEEYIAPEQIDAAADILASVIRRWCNSAA
jgi:acetylornithine deacetylase